jgi:arylsulfatase A-like enzyme
MNAIMIMYDSLNRHFLPPYGCDWVHAPNFERLAKRSARFDNCYAGSMPCMPARRELHTGRYNFLHRSWGPLEPFDESLPELLKAGGVYTHLVSDHTHYWEDGGGTYHTRYNTWEISRGQEGDPWKGHVAVPKLNESPNPMRNTLKRQDNINRTYMRREEDQPQSEVFENGLHFMRTNHKENNWFLQIEPFDPHEPFFTQQHYKDLYPHAYSGAQFDWPDYGRVKETPIQVEHMRKEYAALVSMCDYNLGKVLDLMDTLQMWDDTLLIVCTDHGFLLGEHDWWAKNMMPWYNETIQTPLFIWDPRSQVQAQARSSLVQTIDFAPTLLDFFGVEKPESMQGQALGQVIAADQPVRAAGLFGAHGGHVNVTDGRYVYMRAPKDAQNAPLCEYTLMPTHMSARFSPAELQDIRLAQPFTFTKGCRTMQIATRTYFSAYTHGSMLFDLQNDPGQEHPLLDEDIERRMIALMVDLMHDNEAPAEQYERLGLPQDGLVEAQHLFLHSQQALVQAALAPQESPAALYRGDGFYNLDTPLKELLAVAPAAEILSTHFPQMTGSPIVKMAEAYSLKQIAGMASAMFPAATLKRVALELAAIPAPAADAS